MLGGIERLGFVAKRLVATSERSASLACYSSRVSKTNAAGLSYAEMRDGPSGSLLAPLQPAICRASSRWPMLTILGWGLDAISGKQFGGTVARSKTGPVQRQAISPRSIATALISASRSSGGAAQPPSAMGRRP